MAEGKEIAPAVVLHLHQLEVGLGELVEEIVEHEEGMVAGINVPHHEGRQLVFLFGSAAVEEHAAARLEQPLELPQHALIVGQMLDHAHNDDGVELILRFVLVEVGEHDVEAVAEIGKLALQVGLRHLGVGDAGKAHAGL